MKTRQITSAMLLCCAAEASYAAEAMSELDYYQDLPVVLTASRLSQPLSEAPNAMTVLDHRMIEASGARSLTDLFKLVPGMYVGYYKGSQAFVSYHGATDQYARRMQVMIDGRSVYLPPVSAVNWADLPITLDDIERIEVIRGPAAASHGANSTQGVISIITREAGAWAGKRVSWTRGNKGINDVSAKFGQRGEKLDYHMTLAYKADNGYDNLSAPPNNLPLTFPQASTLLNNSYDSNQARLLNYRADYHPNGVDNFDLQFGFNHDVQSVGFVDKNPTLLNPLSTNGNPPHDLFANSNFVQLGWVHQFDNQSELNLRYYHINQEQHEAFPVYLRGVYFAGPVTQSLHTRRDEIELQHTLPFNTNNRLVYGAAYRLDHVSGQGDTPPLAKRYASSDNSNEYHLFAHDEWRITPALLLNMGAMFERNALGQSNNSPRVALNYHVTQQHTLRIGSSVAYRTPSLIEQKFPSLQPGDLFIPNATVNSPGLLPERLVSREIGYLGEFPDWTSSLDVRLFSDQLSQGIFVSAARTFLNGMEARYQGLEMTLKHDFSPDSELTFNFAYETASSNGVVLAAAGNRSMVSQNPWNSDILAASTPRNSASVLYAHRMSHDFSYSAAYYYQDALQPFDRGAVDYQPIQRRMDVRFAKGIQAGDHSKGEVSLVLQNLFNQGNSEYIASNVFNRRGYVTFTLDW